MSDTFQVIVTQQFRVNPKYTGLTQDQLDWLLDNFFWYGISDDNGNYKLTFFLPLPPDEEEMTK